MDNPRLANEAIRWGAPEKPEKLQDTAGLVRAFPGKFLLFRAIQVQKMRATRVARRPGA